MSDLPVYMFNRVFEISRDLVWNAWSDPTLLAQWYGPGVETEIHAFDLCAGGVWLNEMRWQGKSDFSKMVFQEIEEGARMVWLHHSTDAAWNTVPSQMMPNWPQKLLTTLTLIEDGTQTKLRLIQEPVEASEAEIACFAEMMGGMDSGWSKGFDHMERLLVEEA